MTNEQKYKIEMAIVEFQLSCEMFFTTLNHHNSKEYEIEHLKKLHTTYLKSKNKLYDAIGDMEDYKYLMDED